MREEDRCPNVEDALNWAETEVEVVLAAEVLRLRRQVKSWEDKEIHEAMECWRRGEKMEAASTRLVNLLEFCDLTPRGDKFGTFVSVEDVQAALIALKKLLLTT